MRTFVKHFLMYNLVLKLFYEVGKDLGKIFTCVFLPLTLRLDYLLCWPCQ